MRVLAVDDDGDFLDLLQTYFQAAGIDLMPCTSGQHALALLDQQQFDVVMVDLVMPVMNGQTLAKHIRGRPGLAGVPIIMMTQMSNVPFIRAAGPGDANHFVNKGGEPSWLVNFVATLSPRSSS